MTDAITTVKGPVGPVICVGVPPKIEASIPTIIDPYIPAAAPSPLETPKAIARGTALPHVVLPPSKSPLKFDNIPVFII